MVQLFQLYLENIEVYLGKLDEQDRHKQSVFSGQTFSFFFKECSKPYFALTFYTLCSW